MESYSIDPKVKFFVQAGIVMVTIIACQSILLVWLWRHPGAATRPGREKPAVAATPGENMIQKTYPTVDFTNIYPGYSPEEIDQVQRECFSVRYVYAPFVQFEPLPVSKRFVGITPAGYRKGGQDQPWPPRAGDFVVFVFGGSTTFSYGLPDKETLVAAIEEELQALWPGRQVQCYNFGRGYYFSTQERLLFESLLTSGSIPNLAIFVDGVNDFYYAHGMPALTDGLSKHVAPDVPPKPRSNLSTDEAKEGAIQRLLERYKQHVRMTTALGEAYHAGTIFVGQPVPFLNYPRTPVTYPFTSAPHEHELAKWGYDRFEKVGLSGELGRNFVWCGDALSAATNCMYADSVHYSGAGVRLLAQTMVRRARERQLLPGP